MTTAKHAGWRSRGYLPHCDAAQLVQHVVFGLDDATPKGLSFESDDDLDVGAGACVLRDPTCARIVEDAILNADGERYRIVAWCVMPNHVHVIFEQMRGALLASVVQAWKSTSAHRINVVLGRKGRLWRREYFDRFMRDGDHLAQSVRYVELNPVKAGLVAEASDWPFSSASKLRRSA